jgi:murein DD-endopeptidase MepM/ murein hydrolase activator NlpD
MPFAMLAQTNDRARTEFLQEGPSRATLQPDGEQTDGAYCTSHEEGLAAAPFVIPVEGAHLSSPFGMRLDPVKGRLRKHTGVDLAAPAGTSVKAAGAGTVEFIGYDRRGYGRYVVLRGGSEKSDSSLSGKAGA